MNAFAGIRPKGGQNPTSLAFFPGVCSGGYQFSSGGPTPPPANFYPACYKDFFVVSWYKAINSADYYQR